MLPSIYTYRLVKWIISIALSLACMIFSFHNHVPLFFCWMWCIYTINNIAHICQKINQFSGYGVCFLTLITTCFIEKSPSQFWRYRIRSEAIKLECNLAFLIWSYDYNHHNVLKESQLIFNNLSQYLRSVGMLEPSHPVLF